MKNDNLEKILAQMGAQSVPADIYQVAAEEKEKFKHSLVNTQRAKLWGVLTRGRIIKFAAAAAVLIISAVGIYKYIGLDIASPAYAQVLENIRKAHSVSYKQRIIAGGSDHTASVTINNSGIMRNDGGYGQILIFDRHKDIQLNLSPDSKKAFSTRRIGGRKRDFNWLTWITEQFSREGQYLGRKMFQGRWADLYVIEQPFEKVTIWVDPQTQLPIYREQKQVRSTKKLSPQVQLTLKDFGGSTKDGMVRTITCGGNGFWESTVILSDFCWNVEVNDSLFSTVPPEDFNVTETVIKRPDPNNPDIVKTLKFCAELNDGHFPQDIDALGDPNVNTPMLVKKFRLGQNPEEELNAAIEFGNVIVSAVAFVQDQKADSNWYYNPQIVYGEAKPLCWWKSQDSPGYTVVLGDLSISESNQAPGLN